MTTLKKDTKEPIKHQICPTCLRYVKKSERYPDYVCAKCTLLAVDKEGQAIEFFNITEDGHGVQGKFTVSGNLYRTAVCFIKEIKCKAEEAYLGGIVIRPAETRKRKPKASSASEQSETLEAPSAL